MRRPAVCATDNYLCRGRAVTYAALVAGFLWASPASAQLAANVSLATSDIFRGESTSRDDGAASLEISYDHPSGLFGGASVTVAAGSQALHVNGSTQYGGYALRVGETSIELGLIHRDYDARALFDDAYSPHYLEAFAGISHRDVKLRVYLSPNYLRDGRSTYYGELSARLVKFGRWSLIGHGGISVIPADPGETGLRDYYDLSLQASRSFGKFSLALGVATTNYPVFAPDQGPGFFQNKPRAFATISRVF